MRMTQVLQHKIEQGLLQLYCVDSIDAESFYCWWAHPAGRIYRHRQYEEYILNEVLPFMQHKNPYGATISHGCSLGAFHAANIAFRHPHLFNKLVAFSGRYDLTLNVEYFYDLFNGFYNDDIYYHTPTHYLTSENCGGRLDALRNMEMYLTIGEDDPFKDNNFHLSRILNEKGIKHQMDVWRERAHRGYYWRQMAPVYL
jgi:esterase/lipase superfamily enzyme